MTTKMKDLPSASSLTHQHILSILVTELQTASLIRVLDIGCGRGVMLSYLHETLSQLFPNSRIELYGFDQAGHGAQTAEGYRRETIEYLTKHSPSVDWEERIFSVLPGTPWPWETGFFDAAVSNQVLEHVHDGEEFFRETSRVLRPGGISVHLFPVKDYIHEAHIFVPFAHYIRDHDLAVAYLRVMHRLGFGWAYGTPDPVMQADWFHRFTKYRSKGELLTLGRKHDLRTSFRYTRDFYTAKIRSMMRQEPRLRYRKENRSALYDKLSFWLLKYISGITLFLQKSEFPEHQELLKGATKPEHQPLRLS